MDQLTMLELENFIAAHQISRERILGIKIVHHNDDGPTYANKLKRDLDFIADDDRVVLRFRSHILARPHPGQVDLRRSRADLPAADSAAAT